VWDRWTCLISSSRCWVFCASKPALSWWPIGSFHGSTLVDLVVNVLFFLADLAAGFAHACRTRSSTPRPEPAGIRLAVKRKCILDSPGASENCHSIVQSSDKFVLCRLKDREWWRIRSFSPSYFHPAPNLAITIDDVCQQSWSLL
jgi:hypothetical protein